MRKRRKRKKENVHRVNSLSFVLLFYEKHVGIIIIINALVYLQTMEHRTGKFEKMETQSKFVKNYFPHILVGVHYTGTNTDLQRIRDKVSLNTDRYCSFL